jgi:hypothetical protein
MINVLHYLIILVYPLFMSIFILLSIFDNPLYIIILLLYSLISIYLIASTSSNFLTFIHFFFAIHFVFLVS